jgi:CRP-like cAMP-binding protein
MISAEILKKYPYFAGISPDCLKAVSALCDERSFKKGDSLFTESGEFIGEAKLYEKGEQASHLLLLTSGEVDIAYRLGVGEPLVIGTVVAGELLSLSALIPPYQLTAEGIAKTDGKAIFIEAKALRELLEANPELGFRLYQGVSKALMSRLQDTRVELAGSQAK